MKSKEADTDVIHIDTAFIEKYLAWSKRSMQVGRVGYNSLGCTVGLPLSYHTMGFWCFFFLPGPMEDPKIPPSSLLHVFILSLIVALMFIAKMVALRKRLCHKLYSGEGK